MKLFRYIKMALVFSIAYSCTGDFEEINTDPNRIDKISQVRC